MKGKRALFIDLFFCLFARCVDVAVKHGNVVGLSHSWSPFLLEFEERL